MKKEVGEESKENSEGCSPDGEGRLGLCLETFIAFFKAGNIGGGLRGGFQ